MPYPLAGVAGDIWLTATPSIATTNESCTDSGDHITYTASVHAFWDYNATFTVQCSPDGSGSWSTVTDYTVQWSIGKIVFTTARTVGVNNFVRISAGSYFAATQLSGAHMWDLALKGNTKDTTSFQASGSWASNTATIKMGTGKISTYRDDGRVAIEIGNLLGMQLFVDKANNVRWQFYCLVTEVSPKSDVNGIHEQAISFATVRDVYFLAS